MPWVASPSSTTRRSREALDKIAQLVQIAERLSGFGHEPAHAFVDGERALRRQQQSGGEARGLGIDLRFLDTLALTFGLSPAFLPDQRHEGHGAEILLLEARPRQCGERAAASESRTARSG